MERRKKRITCLILSCFILLLNISTVKAEALPDVLSGGSTIADCVMSYFAMTGSAVANTEWINDLYGSLGSSFGTIYDFAENGMLTINNDGTWQATTALTDAIENSSAYTSLGLDQVFNISEAEAAAGGGLAAASGAATLSGAVGGVASTGVLPVLGGVTAAYWGGISLGTLIAHKLGLYGDPISQGAPIDLRNAMETYSFKGGTFAGQMRIIAGAYAGSIQTYFVSSGLRSAYIADRDAVVAYNPDQPNGGWKRITILTNGMVDQPYTGGLGAGYNYQLTDWGASMVDLVSAPASYATLQDFINAVTNNQYPSIKSPDMIGENGNLQGSYNPSTDSYSVPDMKPQIDTGTQAGVPLTMQDWLNFANSVSNNNSNTNPLPDNSALFDALIDRIVTPISNPNPDPNPNPNPDPYHPPIVTPVPDPDYDPVPDNPDQPDYESEKQKQTEPVPDEVPTGAPWTTDGLLEKFPFCIPKDMIDMVKQFSTGSRQAPYINWRFNPPNTPVDYTFDLDLSDFEDVATLLRMLELAAFIVGLAFATRYLIGAS